MIQIHRGTGAEETGGNGVFPKSGPAAEMKKLEERNADV